MRGYKLAKILTPEGDAIPIAIASSFAARAAGLFGLARKYNGIRHPPLEKIDHQSELVLGLLIKPCSSIHTFFMAYPIDVLFLSSDGVVLKIVSGLKPWRMAWCKGATAVLEMRPSVLENATIGFQLKIL
jgi:Uncharacterized ACR, COG1430